MRKITCFDENNANSTVVFLRWQILTIVFEEKKAKNFVNPKSELLLQRNSLFHYPYFSSTYDYEQTYFYLSI
jgi:hypothetical protein